MKASEWCSAFALFSSLSVLGCSTTVPKSDSNVPELTFYYRVGDTTWSEVPIYGVTVTATADQTVYFWALGHDDEGVKEVAIRASGQTTCSGASGVHISAVNFSAINGTDPSIGAGDSTYVSQSALWQYRGSDTGCAGNEEYRRSTLSVRASVTNFYEGSTNSGEVTLSVD